jgi:hypothetical protein
VKEVKKQRVTIKEIGTDIQHVDTRTKDLGRLNESSQKGDKVQKRELDLITGIRKDMSVAEINTTQRNESVVSDIVSPKTLDDPASPKSTEDPVGGLAKAAFTSIPADSIEAQEQQIQSGGTTVI